MLRLTAFAILALAMVPGAGKAQPAPPYAGLEARPIKALSEQQIADLKAGRGMGLALAAELNGYPGPVHVLELGDKLELTDAQRVTMRDLFSAMKAESIPIGDKLIVQETALDRKFADRTITAAQLSEMIAAIGVTQSALRTAHLKTHLETLAALTPEQVKRYNMLRGYTAGAQDAPALHMHRSPN